MTRNEFMKQMKEELMGMLPEDLKRGLTIEEITVASNANIGGPTTSAAFAIAKGWHSLVVPALLVGTLGYVIGNYYGIFLFTLFS